MTISLEEALIRRIYEQVLETAAYTAKVIDKSLTIKQLKENSPSFQSIEITCKEFLEKLSAYLKKDEKIYVTSELVEIIGDVVHAIEEENNLLLVDTAYHLEQFLDLNVRKTYEKLSSN